MIKSSFEVDKDNQSNQFRMKTAQDYESNHMSSQSAIKKIEHFSIKTIQYDENDQYNLISSQSQVDVKNVVNAN